MIFSTVTCGDRFSSVAARPSKHTVGGRSTSGCSLVQNEHHPSAATHRPASLGAGRIPSAGEVRAAYRQVHSSAWSRPSASNACAVGWTR